MYAHILKGNIGFAALVAKLIKEGHSEDSAKRIAASIGRRKYGKQGFANLARKEGDLALVLKINPYHGKGGRFASRNEATVVSTSPKFRASHSRDKERASRLKTKVIPTKENEKARAKLQTYMDGFSTKLKNPNERAYVQERVTQMINGVSRPSGMSGKHGLTKQRAIQFEALTYKIFRAGREKIDV